MSRIKSLNIHNTDRMYNLKLTTKDKESNFIKVTRINEEEIENNMDELKRLSGRYNKRDANTYVIYKQRYSNDALQEKIMNHGGFIKYYTEGRAPIPIINKLASVPQSEIIYFCQKEHKLDDVMNIQLASMATKVAVDVPIVLPDINPYDYLFSLYPLRYHVDKVNISFPPLRKEEMKNRHRNYYFYYNGLYYLKSKYKYECFKNLQEPLSTWKMNIWLICDSDKDADTIEELVIKDNKRFRKKENGAASIRGGKEDVSE